MCRMLGLSAEDLDAFVLQCSKGYKGTNDNKVINKPPFNVPIDMSSDTDILGIQVTFFGRRTANNRHFKFDHPSRLSYKQQENMLQLTQGTHSLLNNYPVHKEYRMREWYEWATGTCGVNFHTRELPIIAKYYGAIWDEKITESQTLTDADLDKVKKEIVSLLEASDLIPASDTPFMLRRLSTRIRQNVSADESAYMLFKTYASYDLSLTKFNGLLNSFGAYFLGRRLEMDEFSSLPTLRNWFKRHNILSNGISLL